jgi:hypothetical protein
MINLSKPCQDMLLAFFIDYSKQMHLDTLDDATFVPAEKTVLLFEISSIDDDDLQEKMMPLLELC